MADIVVRGLEPPDSCLACALTHSFFRNLRCDELEGMSGFVGPMSLTHYRHPDCPLGVLPEGHGRLGDLDELIGRLHNTYFLDSDDRSIVYKAIEESSPIVPAEGGGKDG